MVSTISIKLDFIFISVYFYLKVLCIVHNIKMRQVSCLENKNLFNFVSLKNGSKRTQVMGGGVLTFENVSTKVYPIL